MHFDYISLKKKKRMNKFLKQLYSLFLTSNRCNQYVYYVLYLYVYVLFLITSYLRILHQSYVFVRFTKCFKLLILLPIYHHWRWDASYNSLDLFTTLLILISSITIFGLIYFSLFDFTNIIKVKYSNKITAENLYKCKKQSV